MSGATRFCFLPYTKKPRPIAPNNMPQIIVAELSNIFFIYSASAEKDASYFHYSCQSTGRVLRIECDA